MNGTTSVALRHACCEARLAAHNISDRPMCRSAGSARSNSRRAIPHARSACVSACRVARSARTARGSSRTAVRGACGPFPGARIARPRARTARRRPRPAIRDARNAFPNARTARPTARTALPSVQRAQLSQQLEEFGTRGIARPGAGIVRRSSRITRRRSGTACPPAGRAQPRARHARLVCKSAIHATRHRRRREGSERRSTKPGAISSNERRTAASRCVIRRGLARPSWSYPVPVSRTGAEIATPSSF